MLTTIFVALAAIVVVVIAAWIFLDLDLTDVAAPVVAPAAGACIIYFYGTLVAWTIGLALLGVGALAVYRALARRRRRDESGPSK
jgi:hypothetical protein